jgi:ribosomal protein S18 acetylase RimI-like enzyme
VSAPPRDLSFELTDADAHDAIHEIEDRLYAFNRAATGIDDGRLLRVLVRDAEGRLVGGATGHTWGGTCEILQLWVAEPLRGAGLGRALLERAEAEARARGCTQLVLTTHSFQAPGFYRKLGYEAVAEVPDYPAGHAELVLRKGLAPAPGRDRRA